MWRDEAQLGRSRGAASNAWRRPAGMLQVHAWGGLVFQLAVKATIILVKTNGCRAGRLSNIVFAGADLR